MRAQEEMLMQEYTGGRRETGGRNEWYENKKTER